ncbi:AMP-binding protein [Rhizohabitans arisaemae]|uniref:AMP-binding protein n=1 Tax=Rhizohabitans arisaemae TaxID=2720610 RepID=UPI0024B1CCDD|nr:AMP-binding protein [Rhizohabitans arisaemae]
MTVPRSFEVTVLRQLRRAARHRPDAIATVVDRGGTLTFGDLDRRSGLAASALRARGLGRGSRVALVAADAEWDGFVVAHYAVYKAGAAAVPLSADLPDHELAAAFDETAADLVVDVGGRLTGHAVTLAGLERAGEGGDGDAGAVDPDDLAYLVRTSGTTGRPKIVAVSHAGLAALYPVEDMLSGLAEQPAVLMTVSIGGEATQGLVHDCVRGPKLVVPSRFDPARHCELIEEHRVRVVGLVPSSAAALLAAADAVPYDFSSVRCVVSSSAPLPPVLFDRLAVTFPGAKVFNAYTLTEGVSLVHDHESGRSGSIGRPGEDTELRIVDGLGDAVPVGETGEIWLRPVGIPPRHHLSPPGGEGATRILDDGWVATGDLGYADADGFVYFVDRRDDTVVIAGHNVSTTRVEAVLSESPAVLAAAAIGVPHPMLGRTIAAVVTLKAPASTAELYRHCAERLPAHARPSRITIVDALPLTPTGKIRKTALQDLIALRPSPRRTPKPEPRTADVMETVLSAWAETLGRETVDPDENLLEVGSYSLLAAQVAVRLSDALDRHVPIATVLEHARPGRLAKALIFTPSTARRRIRPIR